MLKMQTSIWLFQSFGNEMLSSATSLHLESSYGLLRVLAETEEVSHPRISNQWPELPMLYSTSSTPLSHVWACAAVVRYQWKGYIWYWACATSSGTRSLHNQVIDTVHLNPMHWFLSLSHTSGFTRTFPMTDLFKNKMTPALQMLSRDLEDMSLCCNFSWKSCSGTRIVYILHKAESQSSNLSHKTHI